MIRKDQAYENTNKESLRYFLFSMGILTMVGMLWLFSGCSTMKPATSYSNNIRGDKAIYVGKVSYVLEKEGYSIINVDSIYNPIYIIGEIKEMKPPYKDAHIYPEYTKKGELYRYNFIYDGRRYFADNKIMKKQ